MERRFRSLDRNGDSRLSQSEWNGSRRDFNRFDLNEDGYLSFTEWLRS
jgi:Ca2+-binding EF-hand superfamily protein